MSRSSGRTNEPLYNRHESLSIYLYIKLWVILSYLHPPLRLSVLFLPYSRDPAGHCPFKKLYTRGREGEGTNTEVSVSLEAYPFNC
jgi:hypothetical protein